MIQKNLAIGVDIGGSHISCAACSLDKRIYLKDTFSENSLDNHASAPEIIKIWAETISKTIEKVGKENITGIGFAMPGPFDYEKGIALFEGANQKYENLNNVDVAATLKSRLRLNDNLPVRFINDATAFAIGEAWLGKAKGYKNSLSITLGTGFGSAFLKESIPVVSGDTVPQQGCLWHVPFKAGIADDYFSTRGFLERYKKQTGTELKGVKELVEKASQEVIARELFNDFGKQLGLFLKKWLEKFDTDVLVIGGNISNAFNLFSPALIEELGFAGIGCEVATSELQETAAIIGSARLADDGFFTKVQPVGLPFKGGSVQPH